MSTRPSVIVLSGPPCSGKSTLGSWLASQIDGVHLQLDVILPAILPGSVFALEERLLAYSVMARATRPILDRSLSAILDCTYSRAQVRREVVAEIGDENSLIVIELHVSSDVALKRFRERRHHSAVDLTEALVLARVQSYPFGHATGSVNSEISTAAMHAQVLRILGEATPLDRAKWIAQGS